MTVTNPQQQINNVYRSKANYQRKLSQNTWHNKLHMNETKKD